VTERHKKCGRPQVNYPRITAGKLPADLPQGKLPSNLSDGKGGGGERDRIKNLL